MNSNLFDSDMMEFAIIICDTQFQALCHIHVSVKFSNFEVDAMHQFPGPRNMECRHGV